MELLATLMITCKLKTNLFIFAGQDGAAGVYSSPWAAGGSVADFLLLLDVLIRIFISNSPVVQNHLLRALSLSIQILNVTVKFQTA